MGDPAIADEHPGYHGHDVAPAQHREGRVAEAAGRMVGEEALEIEDRAVCGILDESVPRLRLTVLEWRYFQHGGKIPKGILESKQARLNLLSWMLSAKGSSVANRLLNLIVIGAGSMGQNHLRLLSHSRLCNLVGVVESNEKARPGIAKAYRVPVLADLEDALATLEFDAAIIATPTETHYDMAKRLLDAGKHILAEKPFTEDPARGYELLELSRAKGLVTLVGHVERFNPAVVLLQKKIHELGDVYHIETERTGPFPERILSTGVALDLLVHDVDLILALMGQGPAWTFAHRERRVHPRCEDGITALLGFDRDVIAVVKANWLSPTKVRRFRIYGAKGMFEVDFLNRSLYFFENSFSAPVEDNYGLVGMEEGNQIKFKTLPTEPLAAELEYFAGCITEGRLNEEMTRTNIRAIEIVSRILESAETNEKLKF